MVSVEAALRAIKKHRDKLTRQQIKTLCGQAKAGNTAAALKGLDRLLERGRGADGRN